MQALTLFVGLVASFLVLRFPSIWGLAAYLAALLWYPQYVTIQIGTVDFTAARIVILALYTKLLLIDKLHRDFNLTALDKLLLLYFICQFVAGAPKAYSLSEFVINRFGLIFSSVLPYFATRMIIRTKEQYLILLKSVLIISAPLAVIGLYQSITGNNPVGFMMNFHAWNETAGYTPLSRSGFYRANVTFAVSIMFGMFFAMLCPVCAGLLKTEHRHPILYVTAFALMGVGIFASMSSGPALTAVLGLIFLAIYRWRTKFKLVLVLALLACIGIEFVSNRHFYDVIDRFTFSSQTAWYRSALFEHALFKGGMSEHWLTGYGYGVDPGWCKYIDGRDHTDMVNHYLLVLSQFGLLGFVPFVLMNAMAAAELTRAYKFRSSENDGWIVWCLSAGLFGLAGGVMSVSLMEQCLTTYYIMLALAGSIPLIVKAADKDYSPSPSIHKELPWGPKR